MKQKLNPEEIDKHLPQTQCGLCSYKGCMPYAEAIVNNAEAITLCEPGGVDALRNIAKLVNEDPAPFEAAVALKTKPPMLAVIREHECIGCTKCINACPVDAIMGASKQMHSIISSECTGCELCVEPCPVDCIDMIEIKPYEGLEIEQTKALKKHKADQYRNRYRARNQRLADEKLEQAKKHHNNQQKLAENTRAAKKAEILAALQRVKDKKTKTGA